MGWRGPRGAAVERRIGSTSDDGSDEVSSTSSSQDDPSREMDSQIPPFFRLFWHK
jgi:hypothetical protein